MIYGWVSRSGKKLISMIIGMLYIKNEPIIKFGKKIKFSFTLKKDTLVGIRIQGSYFNVISMHKVH